MAAIATPTWTEVQQLSPIEIIAMNIVKGQANGGEFIWDWQTEKVVNGIPYIELGIWKHQLDKSHKSPRGGDPDRFTNLDRI